MWELVGAESKGWEEATGRLERPYEQKRVLQGVWRKNRDWQCECKRTPHA